MRRLFVIIPTLLLLATFALIARANLAPVRRDTAQAQIDELRDRIQILERHLDQTGD